MKGKLAGILLWLGFIAVSVYLVWPWFMDSLLGIEHVTVLGAYEGQVESLDEGELREVWEAAHIYNEGIRRQQKERMFTYLGEEAGDPEYEALLSLSGDNTMGSICVPSAKIDLPIAHGTREKYLDHEAGHLYGTSLPVGGPGTHAVIAGHTGLRNADIFTNLTRVEEGDRFSLRVLDRELVYRVVSVRVVLPEDEDPYLQVEDGRDLVTLYTCTPYGVNSHRLLVTGERDLSAETSPGTNADSGGLVHRSRDAEAILRCAGYGSVPFLTAGAAALLLFGKGKRARKRARRADYVQTDK